MACHRAAEPPPGPSGRPLRVSLCAATGRAGVAWLLAGRETLRRQQWLDPRSMSPLRPILPLLSRPIKHPVISGIRRCRPGEPGESRARNRRGIPADASFAGTSGCPSSLSLSLSLFRDGATKSHVERNLDHRGEISPAGGGRRACTLLLFLARRDARVTRDARV